MLKNFRWPVLDVMAGEPFLLTSSNTHVCPQKCAACEMTGLWERGGRQWVAWSSNPHCVGWDASKVTSGPCIMMWCEVRLVNQQDVPWWNFKLSSTSDLEISSKLQSGGCYSACTPLPKPISGGSGTESSSSRRRTRSGISEARKNSSLQEVIFLKVFTY